MTETTSAKKMTQDKNFMVDRDRFMMTVMGAARVYIRRAVTGTNGGIRNRQKPSSSISKMDFSHHVRHDGTPDEIYADECTE